MNSVDLGSFATPGGAFGTLLSAIAAAAAPPPPTPAPAAAGGGKR